LTVKHLRYVWHLHLAIQGCSLGLKTHFLNVLVSLQSHWKLETSWTRLGPESECLDLGKWGKVLVNGLGLEAKYLALEPQHLSRINYID